MTTLSATVLNFWYWQFKAARIKDFLAVYNNVAEDMLFLSSLGIRAHQKIGILPMFLASKLTFSLGCLLRCTRFPFKENAVNRWFYQIITTASEESDGGKKRKKVRIINVDNSGEERNIYRANDQRAYFPTSDDQFEVFFHGTESDSAKAIITGKIDVSIGYPELDFSSHGGFYVSKDFDDSLQWARGRKYEGLPAAVLIFRVEKRELRGGEEIKGLDLTSDDREWQNVVGFFRRSKVQSRARNFGDRKMDAELRKELKGCHFIEGPISSYREGHHTPIPDPNTYQLCVKSDTCAELFDRSLFSAIFFE